MSYELTNRLIEDSYLGLRMTAEEFLSLPESRSRYELIDGVVVMSPSASPEHQDIMGEILVQLRNHLSAHPVGKAVSEVDVPIGPKRVYRPDIVFLTREKWLKSHERISVNPDLVVEIISPSSRGYDSETKRRDYEAAGVGEYWLVDPANGKFTFLVLQDGVYQEACAEAGRYRSAAVPGFTLDLERVRVLF